MISEEEFIEDLGDGRWQVDVPWYKNIIIVQSKERAIEHVQRIFKLTSAENK